MTTGDSESRQAGPSNAELAERTARTEQKVDHISETVERIESNLDSEQAELAARLDQAERKVGKWWVFYRLCYYLLPVLFGGTSLAFFLGVM